MEAIMYQHDQRQNNIMLVVKTTTVLMWRLEACKHLKSKFMNIFFSNYCTHLSQIYRIRAYRTPLLIRTPWDTLWSFFAAFCPKFTIFSDKKLPKMTRVGGLNLVNFNRTPAFYMRGYGIYRDISVKGFQFTGFAC